MSNKAIDINGGRGLDVLLIVLLALGVRGYLLLITNAGIESDEAIVGLMGKHISEGAPWPVFYYGQHYLGSLESLLAALVFLLIGVSNWALKAVPWIFSGIHVLLVYVLARQFCGRFGARAAALLAAVPPSTLTIWSMKARGGFIELVVIGSLSLILAVELLRKSTPLLRQMFLLGLLLGLGWWVNNQIIFYLAAIGVVFLVHYWAKCGLLESIRLGAAAFGGFIVGGAPFWYANFCCSPRLQSFVVLGKRATLGDALDHFSGFISEALPILLGARRLWTETDVFDGASLLVYIAYGFLFGICVLRCFIPPAGAPKIGLRSSWCLLVAFCVVVPVIFSVSGFGWLTQAPRYLLPLYSVIFVIAGVAAAEIRKIALVGPVLSYGICLVLLGVNIASNYLGNTAVPGQPFVYKGARVSADHAPLYKWLRTEGYSHIFTNYWIGYRTAFETKEEITFTRYRGPRSLRIPHYEYLSRAENEYRAYVLVPAEAREVAADFRARGFRYRVTDVAGYQVLDHVRPVVARGEPIDLSSAKVTATSRPEWAPRVVDSRFGTRWGSGMPQQPGMGIVVALPEPKIVSGLDLDMGLWPQDTARYLVVLAEDVHGRLCTLYEGVPDMFKTENQHRFSLNFPPRKMAGMHLVQGGQHQFYDWSVAELSLFSPHSDR